MKKLILLITILTTYFHLNAQMVILNNIPLDTLAIGIFQGGNVTISNVQFTGHQSQIGYFSLGNAELPDISDGIILSTGMVNSVIGPNHLTSTSTDLLMEGNSLLNHLLGNSSQTRDAAVFEFDFVPDFDSIMFRYVFGSEEYLEFTNSNYNDIFGHFISGPDIADTQNIALIPGTSTFVSINNLNDIYNSSFYINNGDGDTIYTPNDDGQIVQWDGFTTALVSSLVVHPGQLYHMTIAIADVFDGAYDSGLLLKSQSFRSMPTKHSSLGEKEYTLNPFDFNANPSEGGLSFNFKSRNSSGFEIIIINDLGQEIVSTKFQSIIGYNSYTIPLVIPSGIYLATLQIGNQRQTIKFIKS